MSSTATYGANNASSNECSEFSFHNVYPGLGRVPLPEKRSFDEVVKFWEFQWEWTADQRIGSYRLRMVFFLQSCKGAEELDFLRYERLQCKSIENLATDWPEYCRQPLIWLRIYQEFLKSRSAQIEAPRILNQQSQLTRTIAEPSKSAADDRLAPTGKLRLSWSRVDTIALFLVLKDEEIMSFKNDYDLSNWLEANVLFNSDQPLKYCIQEINKFRKCYRDADRIKKLLADKKLLVKTMDDQHET